MLNKTNIIIIMMINKFNKLIGKCQLYRITGQAKTNQLGINIKQQSSNQIYELIYLCGLKF